MKAYAHASIVLCTLLLGLAVLPSQSRAAAPVADATDIASLSLEELANLEISSVSRKKESLASAAASIFVITADDIRRTGATSLPEALRLAPNLQVARISANSWAISARGFNTSSANKLLVLIDGRPIYTPLHSGVFWDAQELFMPDVERIEVISGPNATTWGSNAVNGVINVVTRTASQTGDTRIALAAGEQEQVYGARFGADTDGGTRYRVYGKHFSADETETADGTRRNDAFDRTQLGFRLDFSDSERDRFTLQGDVYDGDIGMSDSAWEISGANLLAHWRRALETGSVVEISGYYDQSARLSVTDGFEENLDIFGISANHQFGLADSQTFVWGTDIRYARDEINNSATIAFLPDRKNLAWISLFAQDEIQLREDLELVLGARAEDNDYTGLEFMPNARLAWKPAEQHLLWTSLSQAVRTPSRLDRELYIPGQPPYLLAGGENFESEVANVIELGYRGQPSDTVSWSLTAFHNDYDRLRSLELDAGMFTIENQLRGSSDGIEGWFTWLPVATWRLSGGFFAFDKHLELRPGSTSTTATEGNDPSSQWQLRSSWDISGNSELELFVRHVNELPEPNVPAYTVVDMRFAWRLRDNFELALKLQNLLDEEYSEFGQLGERTEFGRYVSLQLQWSSQ